MARNFDDASSQYLEVDSTPVTAAPFTMACWFRSNDATVSQRLMWVGDKDSTTNSWSIAAAGAVAGDPVRVIANDAGGNTAQSTSTGFTANTWHHACAVIVSATDRSIFIDGGSEGNSVTSRSPAGADRISIGRQGGSSPDAYMSGDIAEAAIWNIALSDADVALLALGLDPRMVRPQGLVFYAPLIGRHSPEIDRRGGLGLTVTGAVASVHPRMFHAG